MSVDYFAHAAYGIELEEPHLTQWVMLIRAAFDALAAADKHWEDQAVEDQMYAATSWVIANEKAAYELIVRTLGAPPDASLFYTGSDDDRPGRCATDSDVWILGFGLLEFPERQITNTEFLKKADWHTWVTAG